MLCYYLCYVIIYSICNVVSFINVDYIFVCFMNVTFV